MKMKLQNLGYGKFLKMNNLFFAIKCCKNKKIKK